VNKLKSKQKLLPFFGCFDIIVGNEVIACYERMLYFLQFFIQSPLVTEVLKGACVEERINGEIRDYLSQHFVQNCLSNSTYMFAFH